MGRTSRAGRIGRGLGFGAAHRRAERPTRATVRRTARRGRNQVTALGFSTHGPLPTPCPVFYIVRTGTPFPRCTRIPNTHVWHGRPHGLPCDSTVHATLHPGAVRGQADRAG